MTRFIMNLFGAIVGIAAFTASVVADETKPSSVDDYRRMAMSAYQRANWAEADKYLTKVIESPSDDHFMYNLRAATRHELGDDKAALSDINKAIELGPKEAMYYYTRGLIWLELGEKAAATTSFAKAAELDPSIGSIIKKQGLQ